MSAFLLWLACADPVPLPAPMAEPTTIQGRAVKADQVRGYLVRPTSGEPKNSTLLLVQNNDSESRSSADIRAENGRIVLAIPQGVSTEKATEYLKGIPGVTTVSVECMRAACP